MPLVIPTNRDPLLTVSSSGSSTTQSVATNAWIDLTLTANCTLTLSGAVSSSVFSITLVLRQDGTGSRTVSWPSGTKWNAASAPSLSTAAGAIDIVTLSTIDGGTTWFGFLAGKGMA